MRRRIFAAEVGDLTGSRFSMRPAGGTMKLAGSTRTEAALLLCFRVAIRLVLVAFALLLVLPAIVLLAMFLVLSLPFHVMLLAIES